MKKMYALALTALLITISSATHAQTAASVQKRIEQSNKQFVKWFNSGQADSIVSQYHPSACITGRGCGKEFLLTYYQTESAKYTFRELTTLSVTVKDNKATENGKWKVLLSENVELSGKYVTEWKKVDNTWVIFKETVME